MKKPENIRTLQELEAWDFSQEKELATVADVVSRLRERAKEETGPTSIFFQNLANILEEKECIDYLIDKKEK